MKVWIIRHGESETNVNGLWTGWLDAPLTEKGRADALSAQRALAGVDFDKIYSSDLERARMTAEIAIPGCEYEVTTLLREVNVGNIAGKPLGVVKNSDGVRMNKDGYAVFGGESNQEFRDRVLTFMKMLESEKCENIAAFSHAGVLKVFLNLVLGVSVPQGSVYCGNCAVAVFEYRDQKWRLYSWLNIN